MAPDQVDAMVAKFKAAATQQAQFAGMKSTGQGAISALGEDEADLRLKNLAVVADVKIAELERARIPILQKLAAEMRASAVGPDQIKEADDFSRSVDRIAAASKRSTANMTTFKDQASQAIGGQLDFPRSDDQLKFTELATHFDSSPARQSLRSSRSSRNS